MVAKEGGKFTAEWREDSYLQRYSDTGQVVSLRGSCGITRAGVRRLMKNVPEKLRPSSEHFTTLRLWNFQAHHSLRAKAATNSFAHERGVVQWDEVRV